MFSELPVRLKRYERTKVVNGERVSDGDGVMFYCPGCRHTHYYNVGRSDRPVWQFNGDTERPTFTPSLLVQSSCPRGESMEVFTLCHLFMTDGRLQFLSDCAHPLAGQTVDLPDIPDDLLW